MFMINLFVRKETRVLGVVGTNLGMLVSAFVDLEQGKSVDVEEETQCEMIK